MKMDIRPTYSKRALWGAITRIIAKTPVPDKTPVSGTESPLRLPPVSRLERVALQERVSRQENALNRSALCGSAITSGLYRFALLFALLLLLNGAGINPVAARDIINREGTRFADYPIGSIVVDTSERRLYYMLEDGKALKYRVAVGKPHMQWFGQTFVTMKRKNPSWRPTARMRRQGYPAYVAPGPKNPLGVRAIYLGWGEYRIHGTISPRSIGRAASSGCIRMLNKDVVDLFKRVHIGAPVDVIR